ncbi:MAG: antitoxin [Deltaproteobacteria bacterium]|nr:antitoxin [Deltaproteobacteria bacterium]
MAYNIELLKADIADELAKIDLVAKEFRRVEDKLDLPPDRVPNYDRGAVGYLLHNFYNGCENIFRSIARFFENDLGPSTWHKDLLKRMKMEISGYRPRVIDDELYRLLDDFRAFRHKFRHTYGFELDWEKEQIVARKLLRTKELLEIQIRAFLDQLDKIGS